MPAFVDCTYARDRALEMVHGPLREYVASILYERVEELYGIPHPVGLLMYSVLSDRPGHHDLPPLFEAVAERADLSAVPHRFADVLLRQVARQYAEGDMRALRLVSLARRVNSRRLRQQRWDAQSLTLKIDQFAPVWTENMPMAHCAALAAWCVLRGRNAIGAAASILLRAELPPGIDRHRMRRDMSDTFMSLLRAAPVVSGT